MKEFPNLNFLLYVSILLMDPLERIFRYLPSSSGGNLFFSSAPGRADFLNTHQDYKGLPVVPIGINLRCYVGGVPRTDEQVEVISLNLMDERLPYKDVFTLSELSLRGGGWYGDYVRAIFLSLMRHGYHLQGANIVIDSRVPIGSGLSSSASLEVSLAKLLSDMNDLDLSKKELAEISYEAEHDVMQIPCGRLDQYGSSYGGIIKLNTRPPYEIEEIPRRDITIVIADSGIQHRTVKIHPIRQQEINEGLKILMDECNIPPSLREKLGYKYYEPLWDEIKLQEIQPLLRLLPEKPAKRIYFTIVMNISTELALDILKRGIVPKSPIKDLAIPSSASPMEALGTILNFQHLLLRDYYEVSIPELERIRGSMLSGGALGAKLSGAGFGGAVIALVKEHPEEVCEAALENGAKRCWVSKPSEGARTETLPRR